MIAGIINTAIKAGRILFMVRILAMMALHADAGKH